MIRSTHKHRKTRKAHTCQVCKKTIPAGTDCLWYKQVAFKDSDVGRDQWDEGYICPSCENKGMEE